MHNADSPDAEYQNSFYGWRMVMAGTVVLIVSSGIGFYGHGVIMDPIRNSYGWSKGSLSFAITLFFIISGLGQTFIGRQIDRHGPKSVLVAGAVIFGLSLISLGWINRLWQLYLAYSIMALGWCCTSLVPVNTLISNWFILKRGFALSITMTGLSLGGVIIVPLTSWCILWWGLPITLIGLGLLYLLFVIPTALFVIKARPADVNQFPDGLPPVEAEEKVRGFALSSAAQSRKWGRLEAARRLAFWAIVVSFLLALCGQMSFLIHQVSYLGAYLGPQGAATVVSLTALTSIVARLLMGTIIDRLDKRIVAIACFLSQAAALLAMAYSHHIIVLYGGPFVFGLTMGNIIMLQALIIGECFGAASFATVFGVATLFSMIGSAFGPELAGYLFDQTGSYETVFLIFACLSVAASVAILFAKTPSLELS